MKQKWAICLAALVLAVLLGGCAKTAQNQATSQAVANGTEKLHVVATIFPPYDFVREIAGDAVALTMLLPPGAESHSFEPSPQDILTIQNCDIFLYVGGNSDAWITGILESMDTSGMTVLALSNMVETQNERIVEGMEDGPQHEDEHTDEHEHDEDHDHDESHTHNEEHEHDVSETEASHPHMDEHVWTSPKNAMHIVEAISDALCGKDGENAEHYRQNTAAYLQKLAELDAAFEATVAAGRLDTLIFGDRFPFRYFADDYGLTYYAAFPGCSSETEPSAATVAFLIDKVKEEDVPIVFHIELSNEKMADTICEDTGAEKRLMHSCHNVSKAEMDAGASYLSLMTQNVTVLKEALQ